MFAAFSFLLFAWLLGEEKLFQTPGLYILIAGSIWPFLALQLAVLSGTKRQELWNMHVDAAFSAFICLVAPNQIMIFTVTIVVFSNALFVGSFRLLVSVLVCHFIILISGLWLYHTEWIVASAMTHYVMMTFLLCYFSLFSIMGYNLVHRFLRLNKKVKELSLKDPLTGCFNRLYLDKNLPQEMHRCYRINYPLTVIFADIDHFKYINDNYGHKTGDQVLIDFVSIVNKNIRFDTDWLARFGGEEFIVVLSNSNLEDGVIIAERIRNAIEAHTFDATNNKIKMTCSFGVTTIENFESPIEADKLLSNADNALYKAKETGRNRIEHYHEMVE